MLTQNLETVNTLDETAISSRGREALQINCIQPTFKPERPPDFIPVSLDTEFYSQNNRYTQPLTAQVGHDYDSEGSIYLHPLSLVKRAEIPEFATGFVLADLLSDLWGVDTRREDDEFSSKEKCLTFEGNMFRSLQDIEQLFADPKDYINYVLPYLQMKRRVSHKRGVKRIKLPWKVGIPDGKGKVHWKRICLKIVDISAMQGIASLATYAANAGVDMKDKKLFSPNEKGRMPEMLEKRTDDFIQYAIGDVRGNLLVRIKDNTIEFYNQIADILEVPRREKGWGMSTGKIVASLFAAWLAYKCPQIHEGLVKACDYYNRKKVPVKLPKGADIEEFEGETEEDKARWTPEKLLYRATVCAGIEGQVLRAKLSGEKRLATYGSMVDGGRAVAASQELFWRGLLCDLDISAAYGNGLMNQLFALGNPTTISYPIGEPLREVLRKHKDQFVPGLWQLRGDAKNIPFKQSLIISKVEEKFTSWDNAISDEDEDEYGFKPLIDDVRELGFMERIFDASMVLTTQEVHQGLINHDILQIIQPRERGGRASKAEWEWLQDNFQVTSLLLYAKRDEVKVATIEMFADTLYTDEAAITGRQCHQWVRVSLRDFINRLLIERKKHPKGTPMNTFLKLIINTVYGCMASAFFSEEGTGISNMVVANNITARVRALAYLMEVELGTRMSVTDGGVFDLNEVVDWTKRSLNNDAMLAEGGTVYKNRQKPFTRKSLIPGLTEEAYEALDGQGLKTLSEKVCRESWEHLKRGNPDLDILKYDQFSFEVKQWCKLVVHHSKVDYALYDVRKVDPDTLEIITKPLVTALRGVPKGESEKDQAERERAGREIFDPILKGVPGHFALEGGRPFSLTEYQQTPNGKYRRAGLLPHHYIAVEKEWYSHTPLGCRFKDMAHYKRVIKAYTEAKNAVERDEAGNVVKEPDPFMALYPNEFGEAEMMRPKKLPIEERARMVYEVWQNAANL